jgi:peptide-methionine (S)-S-oxide reductase
VTKKATFRDEEQRAAVERSKEREQAEYRKPIVTLIEPAPTFYEAEDHHQQYLEKRSRSSCTPTLARSA